MALLERTDAAFRERYQVVREIGRGGMARVYLARDRSRDDREVAIKMLRPEFAVTVEVKRFHREIQFISTLKHPSILPVLESGETGGIPFFVMPFARGDTLRTQLNDRTVLPVADVVEILRQIGAAIDHAHERNIVHRDLKPENVVFEDDRPMICDFGVARAIVRAGGEKLSTSGLVLGTPHYMSPEQATGQLDIDGSTDIYALGCLAHEMLVGEVPFTGVTPQIVIARHVGQAPRSLRVVRAEIPKAVERAVLWALAKQRDERPPTCSAFVAAMND